MYEGLLAAVQGGEEKLLRHMTGGDPSITLGLKIPITTGDMAFLVEEIFKGRSAISGLTTRLTLVRWRRPADSILIRIGEGTDEQKSSNVKLSDLVCMTKEESIRHDKQVLRGTEKPEEVYDAATVEKVEALLRDTAKYEKYR